MKNNLDYCYHTHTMRCGHASGTDEEYVLSAIEQSYQVLGFSDHAFFPGLTQRGIRGDFEQLTDYTESILQLKKKYGSQIKIHLGFEAEYTPYYDAYYQALLTQYGLEYLILGHHFEFKDNRILSYYGNTNDPLKIRQYGDEVAKAMQTGYFSYVAHPDIYMMGYHHGWDEDAQKTALTIIEASLKHDVPLELNLGGIRGRGLMVIGQETRYPYPFEPFWALVGEKKAKVIIGIDAHSPKDFATQQDQMLFDIVKRYELKLINRLNFKSVSVLK